jgi:hypothetical protein
MSTTVADERAISTIWPEGFRAERASAGGFAVREVAAPADAVFAWIRRVDLHPEFYRGLRLVRRIGGAWPELDEGSKLGFLVGATYIPVVKVIKCDPQQRSFAWGGGGPGFTVCHAFSVVPIDEHRSLVRSDEQWVGPVAKATSLLTTPAIQKVQTQWAEAIARAAQTHPGGPPAAT